MEIGIHLKDGFLPGDNCSCLITFGLLTPSETVKAFVYQIVIIIGFCTLQADYT